MEMESSWIIRLSGFFSRFESLLNKRSSQTPLADPPPTCPQSEQPLDDALSASAISALLHGPHLAVQLARLYRSAQAPSDLSGPGRADTNYRRCLLWGLPNQMRIFDVIQNSFKVHARQFTRSKDTQTRPAKPFSFNHPETTSMNPSGFSSGIQWLAWGMILNSTSVANSLHWSSMICSTVRQRVGSRRGRRSGTTVRTDVFEPRMIPRQRKNGQPELVVLS